MPHFGGGEKASVERSSDSTKSLDPTGIHSALRARSVLRPEGAKKHAILQVRVRTAKYPLLKILLREAREHPFLSFFQILVRLGTAENAKYHTDESQ